MPCLELVELVSGMSEQSGAHLFVRNLAAIGSYRKVQTVLGDIALKFFANPHAHYPSHPTGNGGMRAKMH